MYVENRIMRHENTSKRCRKRMRRKKEASDSCSCSLKTTDGGKQDEFSVEEHSMKLQSVQPSFAAEPTYLDEHTNYGIMYKSQTFWS